MFDPHSSDIFGPVHPPSRDGPEAMQAFVGRHRALFILVGVMVGQLFLLSFQISRNRNVRLIQTWVVATFDPFERSLHRVVEASILAWRTYGQLWQAERRNDELNVQLQAARAQILQLSEQAAEAQRLRALLEFKNRLRLRSVAAEVIATSPGERSSAVFIDKGTDSGLTTDLAVITPEGVAGKIIAVFAHTAQVLLITDPSSGVGSLLAGSRVQGVLKGSSQNECQLKYVMNEEEVPVGETVLTSGLDQIYPKGLLVGTVTHTEEGNIYKNIKVTPAVAFNRLESVLVILKPASSGQ